jgi:CRISPR-associated endonuclease/helicase Cas3
MTGKLPGYFRYWGKAEKDGPGYHLLAYHCLDVAAVGWLLFDPVNPLCQRLAKQLKVAPAWLQHWLTFCLSLHDIGKFATAFQGVVPDLSPALVPSNPRMPYTERHDTLGFLLWQDVLLGRWLETGGFNFDAHHSDLERMLRNIGPWMEIVTGHHGEPPKRMPIRWQNFFTVADEEAASHFREAVAAMFLREFDSSILADKDLKRRLKLSSWFADLFKFETVVPMAFRIAAKNPKNPEREVRIACRDSFRQSRLLHRIIPSIEEVLSAGGLPFPKRPEESVAPAIPNKESVGDAGHRG